MSEAEKTASPRVQSPEARKKTQKLILWGALALIMVIAIISTVFFENSPTATLAPQQQLKPNLQTSIAAPGTVSAQDIWVGKSALELKNITEANKGLTDTQKLLLGRLDKLEKGGVPGQPQSQQSQAVVEPKPLMNFDKPRVATAPPPPPTVQQLPPPPLEATANAGKIDSPRFGGGAQGISMGVMNEGGAASTPIASSQQSGKKASGEDDGDDVTNYIPAGSFARVTMLGGMDAPTGGQAQTNPQPVLLRVDGNAILPNKYKFQIKECHVIGSGYGDIASERAYVRTESMSCILDSGETIDVAIKGYIAGEDGKTGLRGRLVTKQGQLLANALVAGIGSGIGQAFQQSATTQSISALGTTQTTNPGQQVQSGVSSGIGKALDRLANYYIQLAEKTFPVIEIDAGRTVDLILTKGVSFKTKKREHGVTLNDVAEEGRGNRRGNASQGYYD